MTALSKKDNIEELEAALAPEGGGTAPSATVDQGDIDALLAEFQSDGSTDSKNQPSTTDPLGADKSEDGPIGQDDIDRLLKGGEDAPSGAVVEEAPGTAEDAETDAEADELTDQEKMDRLIAELQEENQQHEADDDTQTDGEDLTALADAPDIASEPAPEPPLEAKPAAEAEENVLSAVVGEEDAHADETPPDAFDALDDDEVDFEAYGDDAPAPLHEPEAQTPEDPMPAAPVEDDGNAPPPDDVSQEAPVDAPEDQVADSSPEADPLEARLARRNASRRAVALPEKNPQRRWPRWVITAVVMVTAAVGGAVGYRYFEAPSPTPVEPPVQNAASDTGDDPLPLSGETEAAAPILRDSLEDRFAKIDAAREAMLEKQNEILQLRREYEAGISDMERIIVQEAQRHGVKRYRDAAAVDAIEYGLRTIQRRLATIKRLDAPVKRLHDASEAILYARRLASINLMLVGLAEGIDTARIGREMDASLAAHPLQETLLLPPVNNKDNVPLETIWQRIADRIGRSGSATATAAGTPPAPAANALTDDARIWSAICEGDFSGKYQITSLSAEAARCLAGWQGTELFLNRLTQLQIADAVALSAWKGQWLAMNRVEALSATTAQALFKWPGSRLSLNGLRQLPDGAAAAVANWTGKELELMGLERLTLPMAKALAHWKGAGGRLFIPEKFYRKK